MLVPLESACSDTQQVYVYLQPLDDRANI